VVLLGAVQDDEAESVPMKHPETGLVERKVEVAEIEPA
jgi:hypothetical protein